MNDFAIIPALDLKGGAVVHARGGARAEYRPIETPLGAADEPVALARALLAVTGSSVLYIADLDAIEGGGIRFRRPRASIRAASCGSMPASPTSPTAPSGYRSGQRWSSARKA